MDVHNMSTTNTGRVIGTINANSDLSVINHAWNTNNNKISKYMYVHV